MKYWPIPSHFEHCLRPSTVVLCFDAELNLLKRIVREHTATRNCRELGTAVILVVASAADCSVSRPPAAAADATRYGRRRCEYGRAPPLLRLLPAPPPVLLRLLLVLLYSQFGDY